MLLSTQPFQERERGYLSGQMHCQSGGGGGGVWVGRETTHQVATGVLLFLNPVLFFSAVLALV